ncbi:protein of unknown function [Candidatus Filomicrobium marinum]|uniref:Uncharacterized protein n=1 Tax=Candidatus Filomicrobium marinum TaxID=1608628 RepID=A0A0D6JKZ7_9HYPH|nr:hypothetical protein [Candidatus Filomicrobium marinum]CFX59391.1 protein of unknown function [Candidatus Filomicrobium marinum]CPR22367.1 protein of unknown function [Candidatus Filomicrobium marinum]
MNRIALHWLADGTFRVHADEPIDLFSVDERCPHDRVFKHADGFVTYGSVDSTLGSDRIGFTGDQSGADAEVHLFVGAKPPKRH